MEINFDLSRPGRVRDFLQQMDFHPSSTLGQNFLVDRNVLERMVDAAAVTGEDHVLEVGPGLGVLTEPLLERAGRLVAVEKDKRLHAWLCRRFGERPHARFIAGDYLKQALREPGLLEADAVVSNLPYSVAARILVALALAPCPPRRILVTVQKEVGLRLTAAPGESNYGLLTVLTGDAYKAELLRTISPACFYPVPAVWSAVVSLRRRDASELQPRSPFWLPLVRHAFSFRRKQMTGILAGMPWGGRQLGREQAEACLHAAGIPLSARPGTIGSEQWRLLAKQCENYLAGHVSASVRVPASRQ